jgi:Family of unknown function (DUF6200)
MAEETETSQAEMTQPIIIELGTRKSSNLKDLKKGKGKLWDEVLGVIEETREMLGEEAEGKILVPVIVIYKKKSKLQGLEKLIFPLMK